VDRILEVLGRVLEGRSSAGLVEADRGSGRERPVEPFEVDQGAAGVDDGDPRRAIGARLDCPAAAMRRAASRVRTLLVASCA